jgi:putative sigma-54 modulation protein
MKVKVQSIHFNADRKLLQFIEEKVDKLRLFYEDIIDSEVFLRLSRSETLDNKIMELKVKTPGKTLFAKEQSKSFEEATDSVVEAVRRQMTRHKEKKRRM